MLWHACLYLVKMMLLTYCLWSHLLTTPTQPQFPKRYQWESSRVCLVFNRTRHVLLNRWHPMSWCKQSIMYAHCRKIAMKRVVTDTLPPVSHYEPRPWVTVRRKNEWCWWWAGNHRSECGKWEGSSCGFVWLISWGEGAKGWQAYWLSAINTSVA